MFLGTFSIKIYLYHIVVSSVIIMVGLISQKIQDNKTYYILTNRFQNYLFYINILQGVSCLCTFQPLASLNLIFSVGTIEVHNNLTNVLFIRHLIDRNIQVFSFRVYFLIIY